MTNIQWTKFEQKSIVTFISEELPQTEEKVALQKQNLQIMPTFQINVYYIATVANTSCCHQLRYCFPLCITMESNAQ